MSDPVRPDTAAAESDDDAEVVDALPVPEGPPAQRDVPAPTPGGLGGSGRGTLVVGSPVAVQAAAVAVTGFAAGAAAVAVVRRARTRKTVRRSRKALKGLEVRGTRSFLVDITLLGGRD
ncbi:MAG TPA: hypothetical protein VM712_11100 [Gaiellales bacterium]|nr:hypothetical protein [Gaiellales bacterium]